MVMNNIKSSVLLIAVCSSFLCANNPRVIRKDLQEKYALGLLDRYQLIEQGLSLEEVLDRDIRIMQDYKKYLELRISFNKGIFVRNILPLFKAVSALIAGGVSASTGIFAISGTSWLKDKWEGKGDLGTRISDSVFETLWSWNLLKDSQVAQYMQDRFDHFKKTNPKLQEVIVMTSAAGVISILSGLLCIKLATSLYKHNGKLDASIAKWRQKVQNSSAIIGQLKKLKYRDVSIQ